jgi:hypothetical protein
MIRRCDTAKAIFARCTFIRLSSWDTRNARTIRAAESVWKRARVRTGTAGAVLSFRGDSVSFAKFAARIIDTRFITTVMPELRSIQRASGPFEVTLAPLAPAWSGEAAPLARMSIEKQFTGELSATSQGEMLSASTAVKGSAGYVAMEKVTGTLHGRAGTFLLQHTGTMNRGTPSLSITVVPDSGTGALSGLTGSMQIVIDDKRHSYIFDYSFASAG